MISCICQELKFVVSSPTVAKDFENDVMSENEIRSCVCGTKYSFDIINRVFFAFFKDS